MYLILEINGYYYRFTLIDNNLIGADEINNHSNFIVVIREECLLKYKRKLIIKLKMHNEIRMQKKTLNAITALRNL